MFSITAEFRYLITSFPEYHLAKRSISQSRHLRHIPCHLTQPSRWLAALLAHSPSPCSLLTQADSSSRKAACQASVVATLTQRVPCPASVVATLALMVPSRALASDYWRQRAVCLVWVSGLASTQTVFDRASAALASLRRWAFCLVSGSASSHRSLSSA